MSHKLHDEIPGKQPQSKQVRETFDTSDLDIGANTEPDDMNVDPAQLFMQATEQTRMAICVSDPHQPDEPIIYVNEAFISLTGYSRDEILGRNCRFLQGEKTDPEAPRRIREALDAERVAVVDILNYHKDGTPFWNALHIGPIYDRNGKLQYYYGSQWNVTEIFRQREELVRQQQVTEEMHHRTGNLFAVLSAVVRMSARGEDDAKRLADKVEGRLGALARAHQMSIATESSASVDANLLGLVDAVVKPYRPDGDDRITVSGGSLKMPRDLITPVGLTLHELATNAIIFGSLSNDSGAVSVEWTDAGDTLNIIWNERGGPEPDREGENAASGSGSGSRIVKGILAGIGATIERVYCAEGLTATIRIPREKMNEI